MQSLPDTDRQHPLLSAICSPCTWLVSCFGNHGMACTPYHCKIIQAWHSPMRIPRSLFRTAAIVNASCAQVRPCQKQRLGRALVLQDDQATPQALCRGCLCMLKQTLPICIMSGTLQMISDQPNSPRIYLSGMDGV